jgi:hypothetical protein
VNANDLVLWALVAVVAFWIGQSRMGPRAPLQPILDPISTERLELWRNGDERHLRIYRQYVLRRLNECYNLSELRSLTFELGLDYEEFPHETMSEFTFELLTLCERRSMLDALLGAMR